MKHKNDYSIVAFFEEEKPKKWTYVHTLDSIANFLNQKHSGWKYFNVYNRRTGEYLQRIYKGNAIPKHL
jgi:hypothetical protein